MHFAFLAKLAGELGLKQLSMGMSDDFETAIAFGATHVRVGSAIFGARPAITDSDQPLTGSRASRVQPTSPVMAEPCFAWPGVVK